jgi:hypothetical protein
MSCIYEASCLSGSSGHPFDGTKGLYAQKSRCLRSEGFLSDCRGFRPPPPSHEMLVRGGGDEVGAPHPVLRVAKQDKSLY